MKPLMMKFTQGQGQFIRTIFVNMNQVCYIAPEGTGSSLFFAAVIQDEAAYVSVNESPDDIGSRHEWRA